MKATGKTNTLDLIDALTLRAAMLDAQAAMVCGGGFEAFNALSDELRENYLASIAAGASEVRALVGKLAG